MDRPSPRQSGAARRTFLEARIVDRDQIILLIPTALRKAVYNTCKHE
jgi:hypothetical protein